VRRSDASPEPWLPLRLSWHARVNASARLNKGWMVEQVRQRSVYVSRVGLHSPGAPSTGCACKSRSFAWLAGWLAGWLTCWLNPNVGATVTAVADRQECRGQHHQGALLVQTGAVVIYRAPYLILPSPPRKKKLSTRRRRARSTESSKPPTESPTHRRAERLLLRSHFSLVASHCSVCVCVMHSRSTMFWKQDKIDDVLLVIP